MHIICTEWPTTSRVLRTLYQMIGDKRKWRRFSKKVKNIMQQIIALSLRSICCKTLEHIIVSNINKHLAFESILADCQHGFRSRGSYETQLVQFYHDLVSNLDSALNRDQKQTDVIIMDFAKAFDKVPHRRRGGQGVPGSSPGRCPVCCGLEQVTFTPCLVLVKPSRHVDRRPTRTDCDEAGDYLVPNV